MFMTFPTHELNEEAVRDIHTMFTRSERDYEHTQIIRRTAIKIDDSEFEPIIKASTKKTQPSRRRYKQYHSEGPTQVSYLHHYGLDKVVTRTQVYPLEHKNIQNYPNTEERPK